ncbi:alpha/beta hydrolase [Chryseobacterium sp. Chry.R1]|uniref:alpha/beta fold hydrolase n=1 Tax=Chryseobacterium sp. Chry.R1 TaxID=3139392 RepID=UPI0031F80EEF
MNPTIYYNNTDVDGLNVFYRESGPEDAPVLLLLHGFPTSSHMFRNLIPKLNDQYHIIAPDLPGFGFSDAPGSDHFSYTFDNLARIMQGFIDRLELKRFALYIFDYGAPTGLRLALANPEKITGIISQNGNAYEEGLSDSWTSIRKYWKDPTPENRKLLSDFTSEKMTKFQYQEGVKDLSLIAPESYALDQHFLNRPGMDDIQIDLMLDYRTNVALYPEFQAYFRKYQPRFLAAWGKYDPFFLPPGAEAYKKDIPDAIVKFYETGHFALETHAEEISNEIREFLKALPS